MILLYHRIASGFDPLLLGVSRERFAEHLEVVRRVGSSASLLDLVRAERGLRPLVALTFDDGYRDNLTVAAPLLEAAEIPATVFVPTGAALARRELWWDTAAGLVSAEDRSAYPDWSIESSGDPTPRHAQLRGLLRDLRGADEPSREALLEGLDLHTCTPQHPLLGEEEIAQLDASPYVEIGAHTVTHPVLSTLAPSAQRREMAESKAALERIVERSVTSFAYPYGTPSDYTQASARAARTAGFELACANVEAAVGTRSPRFALPRLVVRDWDGDELERRLRDLLAGGWGA